MPKQNFIPGTVVYYDNQPWTIRQVNYKLKRVYSLNLDSLDGSITTCVRPKHLMEPPPAAPESRRQTNPPTYIKR